jgi:hypothetical protein
MQGGNMIYDYRDVMPGTYVADIETGLAIRHVSEIDTNLGTLLIESQPLRTQRGELVTHTIRFRAIYAINGCEPFPCLFHCYGRLA